MDTTYQLAGRISALAGSECPRRLPFRHHQIAPRQLIRADGAHGADALPKHEFLGPLVDVSVVAGSHF
jgi:hypothetical protein